MDGPGGVQVGGALQVGDAACDEPACDGLLQLVAHLLDPGAQGRHHGLQRRRRPHAVDLLLAVAGEVERSFAQGLRGRAACGRDHPTGRAPLDDEHRAPEGSREPSRDLPGRARADHHQVVAVVHRCDLPSSVSSPASHQSLAGTRWSNADAPVARLLELSTASWRPFRRSPPTVSQNSAAWSTNASGWRDTSSS